MSTDHERPYVEDDLPTYEQIHATVEPEWVVADLLQPTQSTLDVARLVALHRGRPAEGPDPHPHVVRRDGTLWIHNGHHRWMVALLRGDHWIKVRVTDA